MNKAHFQSMFGSTKGAVYQFTCELSEGQDPTALITEKFIEAAGTNLISIVVVTVGSMLVVYSDFAGEIVSSDFNLITDLIPDPVIDVAITEPAVTPPEVV